MEDTIIEVDKDNFEEEMEKCVAFAQNHRIIAFDTEFPGFLFNPEESDLSYYQCVKNNVDSMKLIQIGLTFSNGQTFKTWQFNMNFDINKDKYKPESIYLLNNSGINFNLMASNGIDPMDLAELLISSGFILDDRFTWVCFHGSYDFAYMIKILHNQELPDSQKQFLDLVELYFPVYFDLKQMIRNSEKWTRVSLSKLSSDLNINRIGTQHQAGSDSLVTCQAFFKLNSLSSDAIVIKDKNLLFSMTDADTSTKTFNQTYLQPNQAALQFENMFSKQAVQMNSMFGTHLGKNIYGNNVMYAMPQAYLYSGSKFYPKNG